MPLQNRVTPYGDLIATPAKGSFMGNRGILHDAEGNLGVKRWAHKSWVTCALSFKDNRRYPYKRTPNNYTELFFLDEATALAAGHRPCGQCRHSDFIRFVDCWIEGEGLPLETSIKVIDKQLHADRVNRSRAKIIYTDTIDELPDGVFIELDEDAEAAWLIWNGELLKWQPGGYGERRPKPCGKVVTVLTPLSTVNAISAGYRPQVHQNGNLCWQPILMVGCEGGCITLQGLHRKDGWIFRLATDESSLAYLFNEEDLPGELTSESGVVATWEEALRLLDKYQWASMSPVQAHKEFANELMDALINKSNSADFPVNREYFDWGKWKQVLYKQDGTDLLG